MTSETQIPRTKKLFISYRSSDALKVDKIVMALSLSFHDDGTPRYITWQDKRNLPAGVAHWWDAIVKAITDCDVFVFHVSRDSLNSKVCLAELEYAERRNRPIIPIVIEDAFQRDSKSGKNDIDYWELVPPSITNRQFLFQIGVETIERFNEAIDLYEENWPEDIPAKPPLDPTTDEGYKNNHEKYTVACDCAGRLELDKAENLFKSLIDRNDPDYKAFAVQWIRILRLYAELIEISESEHTKRILPRKWEEYQAQFPVEAIEGVFDPKYLNPESALPQLPPRPPKVEPARVVSATSTQIDLPQPFEWIEIPDKNYSISKYPITNEQFTLFIEAGGYSDKQWWTSDGWRMRNVKQWDQPECWLDTNFNEPEQPVVGVSWYEAMAFCKWLGSSIGDTITLPTENQWLFAAQGNDKLKYPWGNDWNISNCQNSVAEGFASIGKTSPVTQHEFVGNSPFDVVDMVGNVWEWCLNETDPYGGQALRGGSWCMYSIKDLCCDAQDIYHPHSRSEDVGFRIVRLRN